ncbi:MAG TPA: bifunctional proline dehydrogenase/L-glutamate gamma-semialdehyde dehydrogenase [Idiomarina baltica]|jgi:RHH-type proline utilization regulon transcriptional repressor/proline dehydrogenase/delta 1-pyrroline-5-carboxylate dehydrogenase|uniref:Bifunctional protein PutA n=4 Tax=Idiomarina baltica TaxID=190892 RepID=A0A348WMK6_9GAMM|nr:MULTISPECIES: bifunctional proline dehydrogenase/L-glutamate gamma-semialdehyde dehydrogenase PutA [unclassified Idiomarina]MAF76308.1 bifunctional proline dehydrogenase/L-glutamate gamma-semialdehyde dehydrogenase [Idiomarinaceae bacterium]MEC8925949.1 bifunctional proline dehydrogenase/L-glutamate gamma-semialdehyde dehydrogenase PutA [Pseudomonadota bacterium]HAR55768.1 bifunctional proline dehydrogenase/L-glutamate gamma-semialdehyde dehydrogenase [Idiomarina baltica]KXS35020.1 MAG: bifu
MFKASEVLSKSHQAEDLKSLQQAITDNYIVDEDAYMRELLPLVPSDDDAVSTVTERAAKLVEQVREQADNGMVDSFLQEYSLDTKEGIILMCLAEALLRIPDAATADALIQDKLSGGDWQKHMGQSASWLVNSGTWGLALTNGVINPTGKAMETPRGTFRRMIRKLGKPVVRKATYAAMQIMGKQFVLGRTIEEALKESRENRDKGYTHAYDMLGEAALTMSDAEYYKQQYVNSIKTITNEKFNNPDAPRPTISIKLSALHPRYEASNHERVLTELATTLTDLVKLAKEADVGVTIDAEEVDRHELSLELFEKVYRSGVCKGWPRFGLVVQAYSKRALPTLCWITALARECGDEIPVRLVKGAYWDNEIKWSQENGVTGYPVFTRKAHSDLSYIACARYLLSDDTDGAIYPQFATHNAQTIMSIEHMNETHKRRIEYQRLHGMGDNLYDTLMKQKPGMVVRIYAPVGPHRDLLPYLVRRLLENGANSSFVHKLLDADTPVDELVVHPLKTAMRHEVYANDKIPLPPAMYEERKNSLGLNMNIHSQADDFIAAVQQYRDKQWQGGPIVDGKTVETDHQVSITSPQETTKQVGSIYWGDKKLAEQALQSANKAYRAWREVPVDERATCLEKFADLMEANRNELIALCSVEAGKGLQDGIDEVREAVDFCRYYAKEARKLMDGEIQLPGPTGEDNKLKLEGRGTFICISPWNFPLAIFVGQVVAALVTGNSVIAKPAEQTGLIAYRAVQLALEAGVPGNVLHFMPGSGAEVGSFLTSQEDIGGVCFTGSTYTAQAINRALAARTGPIVPLIAETGGQNAMLIDSTSLPEQVVTDVVASAFQSAGQRCSALRVLFVQDDIADRIFDLLRGAMEELEVGDPLLHETDVGPVIDGIAKTNLEQHISDIQQAGRLIARAPMPDYTQGGTFVAPTAIEIDSISQLVKENFGPILHVIRYKTEELDDVIDSINGTGYGLTFGIHSRNETFAYDIASRVDVGNVYINRNQIGAIVGVQPFGGRGMSGTGPKAGGPHYLTRFITEKTRSDNITAVGGNATLLSLDD